MRVKKYEQFFDTSFSENTYLVSQRGNCFLVDPGILGPELKLELEFALPPTETAPIISFFSLLD